MLFKCTQKVRTALRVTDRDLVVAAGDASDELRSWYCNLFYLDRRKCLLFTHATTLFSFVMPRVGRTELHGFGQAFRSHAREALLAEGITGAQVVGLLDDGPDQYGKADNRSVLGSMNDHVRTSKFYVAYEGGYDQLDIGELNWRLNYAPMGYLGMENAGDTLKRVLAPGEAV
jgi:hypothetical protein